MEPIFLKLTAEPDEGFAFKTLRAARFDCPWQVHPEYELILVLHSNGYRIVGDDIASLAPGDLVLVGPGLPHIWQNEPGLSGRSRVHALLIQFEKEFLGERLLRLPALQPIRRLMDRAARGLHFTGPTRDAVGALMAEMENLKGYDRVLHFLKILGALAVSPNGRPLASHGFVIDAHLYDQERMNRIFQFLNAQLDQVIGLSEAARNVGMSDGAFSRFFRLHTGKTFPGFLNELRIGRACRMLIENEKNITEVSQECGFTNLSNFNRQFLKLKKQTPSAFRTQMQRTLGEAAKTESNG